MKYLILPILSLFIASCNSGGGSSSGSNSGAGSTKTTTINYIATIDEGSRYAVVQYDKDFNELETLDYVETSTTVAVGSNSFSYVESNELHVYNLNTNEVLNYSSKTITGKILYTLETDSHDIYAAVCDTSYYCFFRSPKDGSSAPILAMTLPNSSITIIGAGKDYLCFIRSSYTQRVECSFIEDDDVDSRYWSVSNLVDGDLTTTAYLDSKNNKMWISAEDSVEGEELYTFNINKDANYVELDMTKAFDSLSGSDGTNFEKILYASDDYIVFYGANDQDSDKYLRYYRAANDSVYEAQQFSTLTHYYTGGANCMISNAADATYGLESMSFDVESGSVIFDDESTGNSMFSGVVGLSGDSVAELINIEGSDVLRVTSDCGSTWNGVSVDLDSLKLIGTLKNQFAFTSDDNGTDSLILVDTNGDVTSTGISALVSIGEVSVSN